MSWEKVAAKELFGQFRRNKIVTDEDTFENLMTVIEDCRKFISNEMEELIVYVVENGYYSPRSIVDFVFSIRNGKTKEDIERKQEVLLFTLREIKKQNDEAKRGINR